MVLMSKRKGLLSERSEVISTGVSSTKLCPSEISRGPPAEIFLIIRQGSEGSDTKPQKEC